MHVERMQHAIILARDVHRQKLPFDMSDWFENAATPLDCGTAACVGGYMVRDPWMQDQGLEIDNHLPEPAFESATGMVALKRFLDISLDDAMKIFSVQNYSWEERTAGAVANRMEAFFAKIRDADSA